MATAKEYPVKIRKIPVLDKKTGITYFEIRRTRYDPVRKLEFPPKCCYYTFERIFIGSSLGGLMPRSL